VSGRGEGKRSSRCPLTQASGFSCCWIWESAAEAHWSLLSPQPGHRVLTGSSGTSFSRCQGEAECFARTAGQRVPHPDALGALQHATALAASWLSSCPRFPTCVALSAWAPARLFRPIFYLSPIHIFASQVSSASWALGGASLRFQHSSGICHIHTASSPQPLHLPPPYQPSPHSLNPSFPVSIRCCLPTQRKAGRSTALPRIARDVVYAQWWHLNRRCARVMPGQSS